MPAQAKPAAFTVTRSATNIRPAGAPEVWAGYTSVLGNVCRGGATTRPTGGKYRPAGGGNGARTWPDRRDAVQADGTGSGWSFQFSAQKSRYDSVQEIAGRVILVGPWSLGPAMPELFGLCQI